MNKILAVIPARSGSKGLPNKNILPCAGKPLIQWTIDAALESNLVSETLVTTDSLEIKNIAEQCGAWVPFLRDHYLSLDDSSIVDVVQDALARSEEIKGKFDMVLLLHATTPIRKKDCIDTAINHYLSNRVNNQDTLVSVKEIDSKNLWAFGVNEENGYMYSHFGADLSNPRRQELPRCYLPNGSIYIASAHNFHSFYGERIIPFLMDNRVSIDIDYQKDLEIVDKVLSERD